MTTFPSAGTIAKPADCLLTPQQVAKRLQVSVAWVRDHSSRKYPCLPVLPIGGLHRFDPADLEQWIDQQRKAGLRKAS
jgi:predicted DNA-binding transcriptional regulator AlpA